MKYRKLRIAWSVACIIACVLLCVLWVRSYYYGSDEIAVPIGKSSIASVQSHPGTLCAFYVIDDGELAMEHYSPWLVTTGPLQTPESQSINIVRNRPWISFRFQYKEGAVGSPFWFLVLVTATLTAAPWIRWSKRFRLRALLIITALVAVALALIDTR